MVRSDKEDVGMEMMPSSCKKQLMIDEIIPHVGEMGLFQIKVLLMFSIVMLVPSFHALIMVFAGHSPPWRCSGLNPHECNSTAVWLATDKKRCHMARSSWEFIKPKSYSIVTQFDLVCSSHPLSILANSAFFLGQFVGTLVIGWISDRFGRKKVLFPCFVGLIFCAFTSSFSPNIETFIAFRVLTGANYGGLVLASMVMSVELVGERYRALAGIIIWNSWTVALYLMTLLAWLLPNWKQLYMFLSAPFIVIVLGYSVIPESIRWLRTKDRLPQAVRILKKVAAQNKKPFPTDVQIKPLDDYERMSGNYKDLLSSWSVCRKTIAMSLMWFTNDLLYYTIVLTAGSFTGNLHLDFVLVTVADTPGNLLSIYLMNRFGRKRLTIAMYIISCSMMLTYAVLQAVHVEIFALRVALAMISKVSALIAWCSLEIWASESFPTNIRSQAMAVFFLVSMAGGASAPWLAGWIQKFYLPLPAFIMSFFVFISALLCLTMKETKGYILEDALKRNVEASVVKT